MQDPDGQREDGDEGEEEGGADPVDAGLGNRVIGRRFAGNGSETQPLGLKASQSVSQSVSRHLVATSADRACYAKNLHPKRR